MFPVLVALAVYVAEKALEWRTVTCAVLAEIHTLLEIIASHHKWWHKVMPDREKYHPLVPFSTPMYDAQTANIDTLRPERVPDVVAFFSWIKFLNSLQQTRTSYAGHNDPTFTQAYEIALSKFPRTV